MLYYVSQYSKYSMRYGRMTIAEWELSLVFGGFAFPPVSLGPCPRQITPLFTCPLTYSTISQEPRRVKT